MTSAVMNNRTVGREWSEPDGATVYTALFLLNENVPRPPGKYRRRQRLHADVLASHCVSCMRKADEQGVVCTRLYPPFIFEQKEIQL